MYHDFHRFIIGQVKEHRAHTDAGDHPDAELTAWAVIGLGTMSNIMNELGLMPRLAQGRLFQDVGRLLLRGDDETPH